MKHFTLFFLFFFCFFAQSVEAQRFGAGIITGLNMAQLTGDLNVGFNKPGLTAGVRGTVRLSQNIDLCLELLYSRRGSRPRLWARGDSLEFDISMDYVSIPVMIHILDWKANKVESDRFYHVRFEGGLAYSRLFRTQISDRGNKYIIPYAQNIDKFNTDDFSWVVGLSGFVTRHWAFELRFTQSINNILSDKNSSIATPFQPYLRGYFVSLQAVYML